MGVFDRFFLVKNGGGKKVEMENEKRVKIRKRESLIITVLFAILALSVCVGCASATTYTVCPSGCNYTRIQAAIEAADLYDTIEVHSGTYYEHVNVNKQLILNCVDTGSGKPVVDASGSDSAITLSANGITFEGFTVTNSGNLHGGVGIKVTSNNNTITGNTASNNWYGIRFRDSCNNNITGNTVSNNDCGIYLFDSCNNTITSNNASNNGYSIYLNNSCNNNTISGNNIASNIGNGIYLRYSHDNSITGNNASNNWYGIRLRDSSNNTIANNTASNSNWYGIHLRDSSNNIISNNTFVNDGLFVESSHQNIVEDNTVNGKPLVYLVDTSDIAVTDAGQVILVNCSNITVENLDLSNTSVGVDFWATEDSIISNNNVCNNEYGIHLLDSSNNTIANNTASNNDGGIRLRDSSNNIIANNTASNNDGGIHLRDSSNNTIANNTANNNNDGIYLIGFHNNTITGNNASNNNDGIHLFGSHNNTITGNNASNNGYGTRLRDSNNSSITGNNVSNNWYGICSVHSSSNKFYLNNFINNTNNVHSFNSTHIWNSTDEITYTYNGSTHTNYLGNYWSDYKEKYPNAKEIDGYGVWDTPYLCYIHSDNYPLIQPWENYFAPAASIFDTGTGTYPSLMGTHKGTITPSRSINVSKLYTYPCTGTGGHTESIKLEENGTLIANGTWDGYHEDWHNITLHNVTDGTHYVTLLQDHEYNYTIRTGSYPQILHAASKEVTGGTITCTSFVDANGKRYRNRIPAIRLE